MAYLLDHGWKTEHERLTRLGATLDPVTIQHLETIGVTTGWRCLEVGAGAGSMAAWLCRRVGAQGHVVATDLDVKLLAPLRLAGGKRRRGIHQHRYVASFCLSGSVVNELRCCLPEVATAVRKPESPTFSIAP